MLEHKSIASAEFKFFGDDGRGGFSGYASTFGGIDSYKDTIMPGAYAKTIEPFLSSGFIAIGHSWSDMPIAFPTDAKEDANGLLITAEFHSTPLAQDARKVVQERLAAGKSIGLSIGYRVPEGGSTMRKDGIRELTDIELFEVSLVTVPADSRAGVTDAKSGLRAGLTLSDHSNLALAALEDLVTRFASIGDMRVKEGRELSAANRARIAGCRESVDDAVSALTGISADFADLLAATEPKPKSDGSVERKLFAEFLRSMSA